MGVRRRRGSVSGGTKPPADAAPPASQFVLGNFVLGVACVGVGCVLNVIALELVTQQGASGGVFITFGHFAFISLCQFLLFFYEPPFSWKPLLLPLSVSLTQAFLQTATSITNNAAFDLGISVPLHTVFRSSQLAVSLVMGVVLFRKQYSSMKCVSVFIVTIGVIVATMADTSTKVRDCCDDGEASAGSEEGDMWSSTWFLGLASLIATVLLSAVNGHFQGWVKNKHGLDKREEYLLASHLFMLPGFLLWMPSILQTAREWNAPYAEISSNPDDALPDSMVSLFGFPLPVVWLYFLINVVTQFVCIRGVYLIMFSADTLTLSLVLTARKIITLLISIWGFGNTYTPAHWLGTVLAFTGIGLYTYTSHKERVGGAKPEAAPQQQDEQKPSTKKKSTTKTKRTSSKKKRTSTKKNKSSFKSGTVRKRSARGKSSRKRSTSAAK